MNAPRASYWETSKVALGASTSIPAVVEMRIASPAAAGSTSRYPSWRTAARTVRGCGSNHAKATGSPAGVTHPARSRRGSASFAPTSRPYARPHECVLRSRRPAVSSQATTPLDADVRRVVLDPTTPTRITTVPVGECSRADSMHAWACDESSACTASTLITLVHTCGNGSSSVTFASGGGAPSASLRGGSAPALHADAAAIARRRRAPPRTCISGAPARPPDTAVVRAAPVRTRPDVRAVVLALRVDELVTTVGVEGIDEADMAVAREGIHRDERRLGHGHIRSARPDLECRGRVGAMYIAKHPPLLETRVALGEGLSPDLEREAGTVAALASGRRVLSWISG